MTPKEKIEYVKQQISEVTQINPTGPVHLTLYGLTEYEEGPDILSASEQRSIVKKLEEDGFIKSVQFDADKHGVWLEMAEKKTRRSNLLSYIKTKEQFLQHRNLFEKFIRIIDIREIKPKHSYVLPTEEENDDLIQLLIDLRLVEYDWDEIKKQTHRAVGNRIIEFKFKSDPILELYSRVSGKNGCVRKEALELVAKDIGERFSFNKIVQLFTDLGVPESMFIPDTKWRAVFYVLSYYATSKSIADHKQLFKIIQELMHPLVLGGNEEKAKELQAKYQSWLKYDRVKIEDGKVYFQSVVELDDEGVTEWEWTGVDGNTIDGDEYSWSLEDVAKIWVLWNQLILLASAYHSNKSLDANELENLYLELVSEIEKHIASGHIGRDLKEAYQRPFSSLSTSDFEARAKKLDDPLLLLGPFLVQITNHKPDPNYIKAEIEKNSELIKRVTLAIKGLSEDKIDLLKISYEQALFLFKLVVGNIFQILDTVSTGYMNMADEQLNAMYIILSSNMTGLLSRPDFEEVKKKVPDGLPEHLLEDFEEMDVMWEHGGKSSMMRFIGDIDKLWVLAGQQTFPLPGWLVRYFNQVDASAKEHKKLKETHWNHVLQTVDKENKEGRVGLDTKPKEKEGPLPITGEISIKGLQEGLAAIAGLKKSKQNKFPHKLPAGTRWENITIKFEDGENIFIQVKQLKHHADYKEMGLVGRGTNPNPSEAWTFLKVLAELNGELTLKDAEARDKYKKQKELLAKSLQGYFSLDYDPFYPYRSSSEKSGDSYKIKITLIPHSPDLKKTGANPNEDKMGLKDYLAEQAPEVYPEDE